MTSGLFSSATDTASADQAHTAALINLLADELLQKLQCDAQYPALPEEQSFAFLKGIDAKALTPLERESLKLEQAADRRLTTMLDQLVNAIESRKAKLLRKGEAMFSLLPKPGIKSFAEERSRDSGKRFGKATRELSTARALVSVPSAQASLDKGIMSTGHVEVLARALATDVRNGSQALSTDEQVYVTGLAQGRTESDFNTVLTQFLAGRNPLAADAELEEARRRRFFNISYTPQGAHFKGFIDAVAAQSLRTALDAAANRPDADDDRSLTQRSADALINLADTALNGGTLKTGANVRPHVSLVMTESTFMQATKELKRRKKLARIQSQLRQASNHDPNAAAALKSGSTPDSESDPTPNAAPTPCPGSTSCSNTDSCPDSSSGSSNDSCSYSGTGAGAAAGGVANVQVHQTTAITPAATSSMSAPDPALLEPVSMEPAEYLDGSPVPLTELERILCDCEITRVVLNAEGLATNLGRTTRLYTKEHRHAIITRDRTCRFQGCTSQPSRSEIHHIDWWERNHGETSLENGVLVCKRHHTEIHEGTLEVTKDEFGLPSIVVAGACPTQRRNHPGLNETAPSIGASSSPRPVQSPPAQFQDPDGATRLIQDTATPNKVVLSPDTSSTGALNAETLSTDALRAGALRNVALRNGVLRNRMLGASEQNLVGSDLSGSDRGLLATITQTTHAPAEVSSGPDTQIANGSDRIPLEHSLGNLPMHTKAYSRKETQSSAARKQNKLHSPRSRRKGKAALSALLSQEPATLFDT